MSYYNEENLRKTCRSKIYPGLIESLFDLNKHEPFALPFYACLHTMVQHKRRILDTPMLKLRMIGDRIECHAKIDGMAKDYEYRKYNISGRRDKIERGIHHQIGYDPIGFEELTDCASKAYGSPVVTEVIDFTRRLDNFIDGLKGTKYRPLVNEFESNVSTMETPIGRRIEALIPDASKIDIDAGSSNIETVIHFAGNGDPRCEICNKYTLTEASGKIEFLKTTITAYEDSGNGEIITRMQPLIANVTAVTHDEVTKYKDSVDKKFVQTKDLLDKLDDNIAKYAKEATELYNKYYKTSVEEIRDSQTLGKVTI